MAKEITLQNTELNRFIVEERNKVLAYLRKTFSFSDDDLSDIEYAAENGIDSGKALNLFAQSLIGSAAMLTKSGKTVDELIKMVSSPGGTTLAGLDALYEGDLVGITKDCCGRCTKRAYELSK